MISVVIPCFNQGQYVREAVRSVLGQSLTDVECLVVDDGSTDNSASVIKQLGEEYGSERVRSLCHPGRRNLGVCASRNLGLLHATGEFVAFLDADDKWLPGKLQKQLEVMAVHPDVGFVFSRALSSNDLDSAAVNTQKGEHLIIPDSDNLSYDRPFSMMELMLRGNLIPSPTPLVRSSLLRDKSFSVGKMSQKRRIQFEDWMMWLRLSAETLFFCISEPLAIYRLHSQQHTASFSDRKRAADMIYGGYEVVTNFLENGEQVLPGGSGQYSAIAKTALRDRIVRNANYFSLSDIIGILKPCIWSGALGVLLRRYWTYRSRQLRRFIVKSL
ncbi:glycosyltransferase family 2 protein [Pseudomonadota bacterium]